MSGGTTNIADMANMTDEQFAEAMRSYEVEAGTAQGTPDVVEDPVAPTGEGGDATPPADAGKAAEGADTAAGGGEQPGAAAAGGDTPADPDPNAPPAEEIDYKAFYEQVTKPVKAGGRELEIRTPDEVIRLMQQGADYTRKTQQLSGQRKVLAMLEEHGLDENKLSYLIDLDKHDPEAVKKLIKDAGLDPMEIDTSEEPAYVPGRHTVTDQDVAFRSMVTEIAQAEGGQATLEAVKQWDGASRDEVWKDPEILAIIHQQRSSGVYDQITNEMDRRATFGQLPRNATFLQLYKLVGDSLFGQSGPSDTGTQGQPGGQAEQPATAPTGAAGGTQTPVATRPAVPQGQGGKTDAKVDAAATGRGGSGGGSGGKGTTPDFAKMKDEDFAKYMESLA